MIRKKRGGTPPKSGQYKPGQSGNPKGRPKKLPELLDLLKKELKRMRVITEDGKRSKVSTLQILVKRLIDLAIKGNVKAILITMDMAKESVIEDKRKEYTLITSSMTVQEASDAYAQMIKQNK